jgi:hypothetical protein
MNQAGSIQLPQEDTVHKYGKTPRMPEGYSSKLGENIDRAVASGGDFLNQYKDLNH